MLKAAGPRCSVGLLEFSIRWASGILRVLLALSTVKERLAFGDSVPVVVSCPFWRRLWSLHSLLGFSTSLLRTSGCLQATRTFCLWGQCPLRLVSTVHVIPVGCSMAGCPRTVLCTIHQVWLALPFLQFQQGLLLLLLEGPQWLPVALRQAWSLRPGRQCFHLRLGSLSFIADCTCSSLQPRAQVLAGSSRPSLLSGGSVTFPPGLL